MKTPMNDFIEHLEAVRAHTIPMLNNNQMKIATSGLIDAIKSGATELLEKEKQVIMQSYSDGLGNGQAYEESRGGVTSDLLDEKKYYDKTFPKS